MSTPDPNPIDYFIEREKIFEQAIRTNAVPPLKGKITKGKIKWRGIYLVQCPKRNEEYLSQRGKRISDIKKMF